MTEDNLLCKNKCLLEEKRSSSHPFCAFRGRAAGQGMVFWPHCPKQGIQFDLPLS